ncbi:MAG: UDP-N-acetylmuramoyl-L-alanine--D-glutamate ligase [Candidatus Kerfeldbacteria bacterium]
MPSNYLNNKNILILGGGREGISAAYYLNQLYPSATLSVADRQVLDIALPNGTQPLYGPNYPASLEQWDLVIVSPGIPPNDPLLATARAVTTSTNIFMDDCAGMVIGVTGSKGKSTTASIIHNILTTAGKHAYLVGNIGYPALAELSRHNDKEDIFVFEMSSYQLSRINKGPEIAVITNLFPEHLDYHGDVQQYYADKMNITMKQKPEQVVIANQAYGELLQRVQQSQATKIFYPDMQGPHTQDSTVMLGNLELVHRSEIQLKGDHNVENIMAAVAVTSYMDIAMNAIKQGIVTFTPLPHRLALVGTVNGVTFYNDSLATTPEATIAAINALENVGTIILGGLNRGYDFSQLALLITQKQIPNIAFFPDSGAQIEEQLLKLKYEPNRIHTQSMKEAVAFAFKNSPKGSICLLSCASPSYSVFRNYEDRGNQFEQAVIELQTQ